MATLPLITRENSDFSSVNRIILEASDDADLLLLLHLFKFLLSELSWSLQRVLRGSSMQVRQMHILTL